MANCAIVSDIHANLAAFQAVLDDIRSVGVDEIWCLGDIVGYGPQPIACLELARENCSIIIKGNHENALPPGGGVRFNSRAKRAIDWTRDTIAEAPGGTEWLAWCEGLPTHFTRENILFCHGSPREPTEEYLMPRDAHRPDKVGAQWPLMDLYAFTGHTHYPGVFEENEGFTPPEQMLGGNLFMLEYQYKAIINVGSTGQPRDRNPDACYVTFDGDSVVYRRVPYDTEATRSRIKKIPELDDALGDRLVLGK